MNFLTIRDARPLLLALTANLAVSHCGRLRSPASPRLPLRQASPAGPEWHDAPSSIARFGIVHLRKSFITNENGEPGGNA
jgi:hypothetical protein